MMPALDTAFTTDPVQARSKAWLPTGPGRVKIQAGWEPANESLGVGGGTEDAAGPGGGPPLIRAGGAVIPKFQPGMMQPRAPFGTDQSQSPNTPGLNDPLLFNEPPTAIPLASPPPPDFSDIPTGAPQQPPGDQFNAPGIGQASPWSVGVGAGPAEDVAAPSGYNPDWQQTWGNELVPNQLNTSEALAACGPAAAVAFARTYGRNPTAQEALDVARKNNWWIGQMQGPESEISLLQYYGVPARLQYGPDVSEIIQDIQNGHPVILDTPHHYFVVDGYNAQTGQFHTGNSGSPALKFGSKWMTWSQINNVGMGQVRAAIFLQHPLANTAAAPSVATQTPSPQSTGDAVVSQSPSRPRMDMMSGAGDQPPAANAGQPVYGAHRDDSYGGYGQPSGVQPMSSSVPPTIMGSQSPGVPGPSRPTPPSSASSGTLPTQPPDPIGTPPTPRPQPQYSTESHGVPPSPMNASAPSTPGPTYAGGLAGGESTAPAPTAGQPVTGPRSSQTPRGFSGPQEPGGNVPSEQGAYTPDMWGNPSPAPAMPPSSGPGVSFGARPETFGRPAPSSQGAPVAPGVAPAQQPPAPTDVNSSIHGWGMSPLEVPSHQVLPGDWNQPGPNWSQPGNPNTSPWVNTTYGQMSNFPPTTNMPPGEHFTGSSPSDPSGFWTTTPAAPGVAAGAGDTARGQGLLHGQPVPGPTAPAAKPPNMSGQVWVVDGQPSTDYSNPNGYWTNPSWTSAANAATTSVGGGQAVGRGASGDDRVIRPLSPWDLITPEGLSSTWQGGHGGKTDRLWNTALGDDPGMYRPMVADDLANGMPGRGQAVGRGAAAPGAQPNMSHVPGWPRIPNNPSWPPPWPAPWPARWPQPNLGASSTPYQAQSQGMNTSLMPSVGPTTSQSALRGSSS